MTDNDTAITATIQDREQALTFVIRPLEPFAREQWLFRALRQCVKKADASEADYLAAGKFLARAGYYGLIAMGRDAEVVLPLLDQLLGRCFLLSGGEEWPCTPESLDAAVEDPRTIMALKHAAIKHNLDFLLPDPGELAEELRAAYVGPPLQ